MSSFQGLSIALSSLQTQRRAMDVAGQNIANAATPGYTRQRVETSPIAGPRASLSDGVRGWTTGSGVQVTQVARLADRLASSRLETATGDAALAGARAGILAGVEDDLGGLSTMSGALGKMYGAWSGLAIANPVGQTGDAARVTVVGRSEEVAATLRQGAARTSATWSDVRGELGTLTTEVNAIASSVADLNRLIVTTEGTGAPAHELADQRDLLVRQLSSLVGATSVPRDGSGAVDVVVGGQKLVDGAVAGSITVSGPTAMTGSTTPATTISLAGSTDALAVGGTAAGLTEALSITLPGVMGGWDRVATTLADQVNGLHGDPPVFTANDGGDVTAATITASISAADVKAGTSGTDTSIANGVVKLSESTTGPDARWRTFFTATAGAASAADVRARATASAADSAQGVLTSSTGVDVDSEMVDLLTYQRAYEGAARVLTAVDQMLDTLINRTGVVGR